MNEESIQEQTASQETPLPKEEELLLENEWKEKHLRLLAELENMRKRLQKEKAEAVRFASENTIAEFLPVIDGLEQALKHSENASPDVKNWAIGFQMFLTQLKEVLVNHGVVAFHSEGNRFDPHYHEAMEIEETEDYPEGSIIKEFSKGYKTSQRTIRAAKVKVAKRKEPSQTKEELEDKKGE